MTTSAQWGDRVVPVGTRLQKALRSLAQRDAHVAARLPAFLAGKGGDGASGGGAAAPGASRGGGDGGGAPSSPLSPPRCRIAIAGSGGGFRAMVAFLGVLVGAERAGLLECVTFVAGTSGST